MSRVRKQVRHALFKLPLPARRQAFYLFFQRRPGRFRKPVTFTEKINWRIINDRRPLIGMTCDKLRTKDHAEQYGARAPKTYWSGTDIRELAAVDLPERWILKPNHRSALVHFGKGRPDVDELVAITEGWLEGEQGEGLGEWAYTQSRKLLLVEEMLGDGIMAPSDFRFHTFGGVVRAIQVEYDAHAEHRRRFYSPDWKPLDVRQLYPLSDAIPKPQNFEEMLEVARRVAEPFDYIRVDLYNVDGEIYLGEITPYPTGGLSPITPREYDRELGSYWELPDKAAVST